MKLPTEDGKMRMTDVAKVARLELEARTGKNVVSALKRRKR
ncbi:MAG: hypothetical protein WAU08_06870 [Flavobacteriales bacterium]